LPGPLWPTGPAELPAVVDLEGQRYTVPRVPGPRLAWAIAKRLDLVPELLTPDDRAEVHRRLRRATDRLDVGDLDRATVQLAATLCGIDTGVNGWRAGVRLCSTLIGDWPRSAGALAQLGIDPARAPLWRSCAGLYFSFIDPPGAKDDEVKNAKTELYAPLPQEPSWMRPVKPKPAVDTRAAQAGAMALFQNATGRKPALVQCAECRQVASHATTCSKAPPPQGGPRRAGCPGCGRSSGHARGCPRSMAHPGVRPPASSPAPS
jgi:hypothetical protein